MAQSDPPPDESHGAGGEVAALEQVRRDLTRQDIARSAEESAIAGGLAGVALAGVLFVAGSVARRVLSHRADRRRGRRKPEARAK